MGGRTRNLVTPVVRNVSAILQSSEQNFRKFEDGVMPVLCLGRSRVSCESREAVRVSFDRCLKFWCVTPFCPSLLPQLLILWFSRKQVGRNRYYRFSVWLDVKRRR